MAPGEFCGIEAKGRQYFKKKEGSIVSISQRDKPNNAYALYEVPKIVKLIDTKNRVVAAMGCGEGL